LKLEYVIAVLPEAHQLKGELSISRETAGPLRLAVPTWVPGAYGLMKYGRDLFEVRAVDGSGAELEVVREGWSGFRIDAAPSELRLTWRAAAYDPVWGELSGLVDHTHAVLRATRYLRVPEHTGPCTVRYALPAGWALHHPSGAHSLGENRFLYASFAALLDAPVVCGAFETHTRTVQGVKFHHVFLDRAVGFESEVDNFLDALCRVAEGAHQVFGGFPFADYTYIFTHSPTAHWGLEHADCTMIGLGENVYIDPAARNAGVRVCAHELFHAWNVCRLKPVELATAGFESPPAPDTLWVAEGVTRYYEFLLGTRAGEITPEAFFSNVVNYHRHLSAQPASARVSAVDSSRATFLNHNKYPGSINSTIDYYDAGMLIAFEVDAALRAKGSSLDARMFQFYIDRMNAGGSYTLQQAVDALGTPGLMERVKGTLGDQTPQALEQLGFSVQREPRAQLGLVLASNTGPEIANVLDTAPAAKTGIAAGDIIQRVDGFPFSLKALQWLTAHRPELQLTVLRGHRTLEFTLGVTRLDDLSSLTWVGDARQLAALASWLGVELAWKKGRNIPLSAFDNFHGIQMVF
jgi:predicted metalloprotease with PDZ domain